VITSAALAGGASPVPPLRQHVTDSGVSETPTHSARWCRNPHILLCLFMGTPAAAGSSRGRELIFCT
jgi:hypothetical protein